MSDISISPVSLKLCTHFKIINVLNQNSAPYSDYCNFEGVIPDNLISELQVLREGSIQPNFQYQKWFKRYFDILMNLIPKKIYEGTKLVQSTKSII